jgi:hypothetical protein
LDKVSPKEVKLIIFKKVLVMNHIFSIFNAWNNCAFIIRTHKSFFIVVYFNFVSYFVIYFHCYWSNHSHDYTMITSNQNEGEMEMEVVVFVCVQSNTQCSYTVGWDDWVIGFEIEILILVINYSIIILFKY